MVTAVKRSRGRTVFRWAPWCWATAALAAGICGAWAYRRAGATGADIARDLSVGWSYAGAGLVAWWRRPANPTGRIMLAEGLTWFLGNLQGTGIPLLFTLGVWGEALNLAVLAHLLLAFPEGRLATALDRAVVVSGYALVAFGGLVRAALYDPALHEDATYLSCRNCRPDLNLLLIRAEPGWFDAVDLGYRWAGALLTVVCLGALVRRWRISRPARRRVLLSAWVSVAIAVAFVGWEVVHLLAPEAMDTADAVLTWPSDASQVLVPIAFLISLLRMRLRRAYVGNLVIEVGADPTPQRLQDTLARLLGDPSLRLGLLSPDVGSSEGRGPAYVDPAGQALPLPPPGSGASTTVVDESAGTPTVVLVHDAALEEDGKLLLAVSSSVRLCLRSTAADATGIGSRLLQAADEERRRLERDLHDGAQTRLVFALMTLRRLDAGLSRGDERAPDPALRRTVAEADQAVRQALEELRDLARGIHPAVLTRDGLAAAVRALAPQAHVPLLVMVDPGRFPPLTESTAYFVICEALSNAVKYSQADVVSVSVRRETDEGADRLVVEVVDDGIGGAAPAGGSGLRGLADRVAATGGALWVTSPPGSGTRLRAELPCA
ncbi:hypothetical protein GCM10015536_74230 [Streptomyces griseomycini]|nr:hypothetical protein GCM10015536_74230 [Streptomyces griseomycini]